MIQSSSKHPQVRGTSGRRPIQLNHGCLNEISNSTQCTIWWVLPLWWSLLWIKVHWNRFQAFALIIFIMTVQTKDRPYVPAYNIGLYFVNLTSFTYLIVFALILLAAVLSITGTILPTTFFVSSLNRGIPHHDNMLSECWNRWVE